MGQVEQFGNAARALRYTRRHRRFSSTMLAVMVAPFLIGVVVAVGLLVHDLVWGSDSAPESTPPPPITAPPPP